MVDERQRKANTRLALILFAIALAIGLGFMARMALLGR